MDRDLIKRWLLFLLLISGAAVWGYPASPVMAQQQKVRFRSYSIESGLSQSTVRAVTQDRRGFIWLATSDGLNRFDGGTFQTHLADPSDPHSLSNNLVVALAEGLDGALWVGTIAGLNRYDSDNDVFRPFMHDPRDPTSLGSEEVLSLLVDRGGALWVGLDGGGLDRYLGEEHGFAHYRRSAMGGSLAHDVVRALMEDRDGNLWVGTDAGLNLLDGEEETFRLFLPDSSGTANPRHNSIRSLFQDEDGRIWVGTDGGGVYSFDMTSGRFTPHHQPRESTPIPSADPITGFAQGQGGTIWMGSYGGGLYSYDPLKGSYQTFTHDPRGTGSLGADRVTSIFVDSAKALWIGTYGGGVSTLHHQNFKFEPLTIPSDTINRNYIRAFAEEGDSVLWIGSQGGGLSRLDRDRGEYTFFDHNPKDPGSLSSSDVFSLLVDSRGDLWVGTTGGWVNRLHRGSGQFTRSRVELPDGGNRYPNEVRAMIEDSRGQVWVGVDGAGIHVAREGQTELQPLHHDPEDPQSLSSDRVRALFEDQEGSIWVGTFGDGLSRLDPESGTFDHLRQEEETPGSLADNRVLSIFQGQSGDIWISTRGGLERYNPKENRFTHLRREDGLPNEAIYGVLEDDSGGLWLSHNKGITRFDPTVDSFETFTESDGLQSSEFNGGAYLKGKDGRFLFGGIKGYNAFFPDSIQPHGFIPPVWITDFQLGNKTVPIGEGADGRTLLTTNITSTDAIELSHSDRVLTFEFATLNYVVPERNQYAYRMEGLEEEWNYVGTRRFATYTTLPPGEYTFRVRGANNDGQWNEEGASLRLTMRPPWWKTLWFRGGVVLLLVATAFRVYRNRVRSMEEQQNRLEVEVTLRTQELQAKTNELEETLTELQETKGELLDAAHKAGMADIATGVLHNVGNILNSLRTSVSVIEDVADNSKLPGLRKATDLLETNRERIGTFLSDPTVGQRLVEYLVTLPDQLAVEQDAISSNARRASEKLEAIANVVSDQQRIARGWAFTEVCHLESVAKEAMELEAASVEKHAIHIETNFNPASPVEINRSKVHHILVNLYKNAKESMRALGPKENQLTISVGEVGDEVIVTVGDNGQGISPEKLDLIFSHGFTTKAGGHGFGLHSCANYMSEMGGRIWAESDGPGRGASFFLAFPAAPKGLVRERV